MAAANAQTGGDRSGRRVGASEAYRQLRRQIIDMQLAPNVELDEVALALRLGVSRTPLREALAYLAAEGLIVQVPNRGAHVAPLEVSDLREYFEALDYVQRAVYRLAAQRADDTALAAMRSAETDFKAAVAASDARAVNAANRAFHDAIGWASKNAHLRRAYERLLVEGSRIAYLCFTDASNGRQQARLERTAQEHDDHIAAIAAGDAHRAEALAADHAELFRQRVAESLVSGSHELRGATVVPLSER